MYQIINVENGKVIGCVSEPNYIRLKEETGCFVSAKKPEDRQGIAFQSVAYNLSGTAGVGAPETVVLSEFDAATVIVEVPEIKEAVALIEDALCELDKK